MFVEMEQSKGARLLVFLLTFISYALYHATRKNLSGVKNSISADWLDNGTAGSHRHLVNFGENLYFFKKFLDNEDDAKHFLGSLDAIFMILYAMVI